MFVYRTRHQKLWWITRRLDQYFLFFVCLFHGYMGLCLIPWMALRDYMPSMIILAVCTFFLAPWSHPVLLNLLIDVRRGSPKLIAFHKTWTSTWGAFKPKKHTKSGVTLAINQHLKTLPLKIRVLAFFVRTRSRCLFFRRKTPIIICALISVVTWSCIFVYETLYNRPSFDNALGVIAIIICAASSSAVSIYVGNFGVLPLELFEPADLIFQLHKKYKKAVAPAVRRFRQQACEFRQEIMHDNLPEEWSDEIIQRIASFTRIGDNDSALKNSIFLEKCRV